MDYKSFEDKSKKVRTDLLNNNISKISINYDNEFNIVPNSSLNFSKELKEKLQKSLSFLLSSNTKFVNKSLEDLYELANININLFLQRDVITINHIKKLVKALNEEDTILNSLRLIYIISLYTSRFDFMFFNEGIHEILKDLIINCRNEELELSINICSLFCSRNSKFRDLLFDKYILFDYFSNYLSSDNQDLHISIATLFLKSVERKNFVPQFGIKCLEIVSLLLKSNNSDVVKCGFEIFSLIVLEVEEVVKLLEDGTIIKYLTNMLNEMDQSTNLTIIHYFSLFCTCGDIIIKYFVQHQTLSTIKFIIDINNNEIMNNVFDLITNWCTYTYDYTDELFNFIYGFNFIDIFEYIDFNSKKKIIHFLRICSQKLTIDQTLHLINPELLKIIIAMINNDTDNSLIYDSCVCVVEMITKSRQDAKNKIISIFQDNDFIEQITMITAMPDVDISHYARNILSLINNKE